MMLDFDLDSIRQMEFGIAVDLSADYPQYGVMTIHPDVQMALQDIAKDTWTEMLRLDPNPPRYNSAEKYASAEHLYIELSDVIVASISEFHAASNLQRWRRTSPEIPQAYCYFARFTDFQNRRLTALRRATQLKGVLKSHLLRIVDDSLDLIQDRVLRLDDNFDLLVDADIVHVLHPAGLESIGQLQGAVLAAVPQNVTAIAASLGFVDFANIRLYAQTHSRAARYLASIRAENESVGIDKQFLERQCDTMGIPHRSVKGVLTVDDDRIMDFLELLDRRLYSDPLIPHSEGHYKASSRIKL